jgi:protein-S-isoprenylcysteine O-methyltransferase Ste14
VKKLIVQTLSTFIIGVWVLGMLLFLPAWTFRYWQAWIFIAVFILSINAIGLYLSLTNPILLERRKKFGPTKEQSLGQRVAISIGMLVILSVFVFSALAHRFEWSPVPGFVSIVGDSMVVIGLLVILLVFRKNSFGGSSIETVAGQKVVSTGPYALVRHPMYAGVLLMLFGIPLALDAWWSLAIIIIGLPGLIWRILDEERSLKKDLPGYVDYIKKVRYRLLPYVW